MLSPRPKEMSAGVRFRRLSCLSALQATPAGQRVAVMIVVLDEALNAGVEITGQEVVLKQDAVFQGLVPASPLAGRQMRSKCREAILPCV